MKNPHQMAFVQRSDIAHNQQKNSGVPSSAEESRNLQSKLLEVQHGNYADPGKAGASAHLEGTGAGFRELLTYEFPGSAGFFWRLSNTLSLVPLRLARVY